MRPWCDEGEGPSAVNVNLCGIRSHRSDGTAIMSHCLEVSEEPQMIVSLCFGAGARFRWDYNSRWPGVGGDLLLSYGDLLVLYWLA